MPLILQMLNATHLTIVCSWNVVFLYLACMCSNPLEACTYFSISSNSLYAWPIGAKVRSLKHRFYLFFHFYLFYLKARAPFLVFSMRNILFLYTISYLKRGFQINTRPRFLRKVFTIGIMYSFFILLFLFFIDHETKNLPIPLYLERKISYQV